LFFILLCTVIFSVYLGMKSETIIRGCPVQKLKYSVQKIECSVDVYLVFAPACIHWIVVPPLQSQPFIVDIFSSIWFLRILPWVLLGSVIFWVFSDLIWFIVFYPNLKWHSLKSKKSSSDGILFVWSVRLEINDLDLTIINLCTSKFMFRLSHIRCD
jgi:hypothetical protein